MHILQSNKCDLIHTCFKKVFQTESTKNTHCSDRVCRSQAAAAVLLVVFWRQRCCQCVSLSLCSAIDWYLLSLCVHDVHCVLVKGCYLAVRLSCRGTTDSSPTQSLCHPFKAGGKKEGRKITPVVDLKLL